MSYFVENRELPKTPLFLQNFIVTFIDSSHIYVDCFYKIAKNNLKIHDISERRRYMKEKSVSKQKSKTNQWHSEKIKVSLKIKNSNTKVTLLSKWYLVHKGKKDGKKDIPYIDTNGIWISPTIQEESNKVNTLISNVYRYLCHKNSDCYIGLEYSIAEFEQRVLEVNRLHDFLKQKINRFDIAAYTSTQNNNLSSEEKDMLEAKRKSEEDLEDIGIRIRRFKEYQQPLEPLYKRFTSAKKELEHDFDYVVEYYKQIELINKQLKVLYAEFCSTANTRIAWYWQGVLKKHSQRDKMLLEIPKTDPTIFDTLYGMNINSISKRIEELRVERDKALSLSIV